ncbi:hypothetical protein VTN77DRAFT_1949 [Rasamsonia byssochlamydoides]|uniref:uncharacterized protein n=1 Tax=Rasamsonia byssochlamydoides TaxID=89139 RepID=UPI0037448503
MQPNLGSVNAVKSEEPSASGPVRRISVRSIILPLTGLTTCIMGWLIDNSGTGTPYSHSDAYVPRAVPDHCQLQAVLGLRAWG